MQAISILAVKILKMNILEFLQSEGITTRAKGSTEHSSPCPVCGGNDRFQSWPERNRWLCRGCNKSGDLIELVRLCKGFSFSEACRFIGEDHRISSGGGSNVCTKSHRRPEQNRLSRKPKPVDSVSSAWLSKVENFIQWSHEQLLKDFDRLGWLKNDRGINLETVKRFKLGWNPKDFFRDRQSWGLPEEISQKTGKPKKLFLPSGLVIPGRDFAGRIARLKIRTAKPKPEQPKYYFLPGGSAALCFFGEPQKAFIVVESELDAILLAQESEDQLSAISTGSASIRPDLESHQILSSADLILISLDNDDAGGKASVQFWREAFVKSVFLFVPLQFGKDPSDAFKRGLDLKQWLRVGIDKCSVTQNLETGAKGGCGELEKHLDDVESVGQENNSIPGKFEQELIARFEKVIFEALRLYFRLKSERRGAEAGQLDTLMAGAEVAAGFGPDRNLSAALHFLEKFVWQGSLRA